LFNGTTQFANASAQNQVLVSSFEKPFIVTMIGPTIASGLDSQMIPQNMSSTVAPIPIHTEPIDALNSKTLCFANENSSSESVLSIISEDTQMSNHIMNSTPLPTAPQVMQRFDPISVMSFEETMQEMPDIEMNTNIGENVFTTDSQIVSQNTSDIISETVSLPVQPVSQYLPFNPLNANNSPQMSHISSVNHMNSMSCDNMSNILEPISSSTPMDTNIGSTMSTEPNLSIVTPMPVIETKLNLSQESVPMESALSLPQNPVLTSTAGATPVTQATNISALSEMSDAELLCFINPATFDQI